MILHNAIKIRYLVKGSVGFISVVLVWTALVILLDELLSVDLISNPSPPVTMLGLAVAFFLGFKNTAAFHRWREARYIWGGIVNGSRDWGNTVGNLVTRDGTPINPDVKRTLIDRHIAWLNMLAYQLRQPSPYGRKKQPWMFGIAPVTDAAEAHQRPESWTGHQLQDDMPLLEDKTNKAAYLLYRQSEEIAALAREKAIDPFWHVALMDRLSHFTDAQGQCERLKNTPFPRQVAGVGRIFSWIFICLLPLAFNDDRSFATDVNSPYLFLVFFNWLTFAPVGALVCWVFYVTERVSASMEDPFEGDVTDVPISAICRTIEIDLREMTGFGTAPPPPEPIGKALL